MRSVPPGHPSPPSNPPCADDGRYRIRTPTVLPVIGALACGFLATPFAGRPAEEYRIAGILLAIGVVLWFVTVLVTRRTGGQPAAFDPHHLTGDRPAGPKN